MIQPWEDSTATWNLFGNDGVSTNNVQASSVASFTIPSPGSTGFKLMDVTADVSAWVALPASSNQGWVLINSSRDGWDFDSGKF